MHAYALPNAGLHVGMRGLAGPSRSKPSLPPPSPGAGLARGNARSRARSRAAQSCTERRNLGSDTTFSGIATTFDSFWRRGRVRRGAIPGNVEHCLCGAVGKCKVHAGGGSGRGERCPLRHYKRIVFSQNDAKKIHCESQWQKGETKVTFEVLGGNARLAGAIPPPPTMHVGLAVRGTDIGSRYSDWRAVNPNPRRGSYGSCESEDGAHSRMRD